MGKASFPEIGSKYRITSLLGEGAMGAVYKAEHSILNRTVAIKTVSSQLMSSGNSIERFLNEARTSASLNHPNIVQTYDIDRSPPEAESVFFLVCEYVEGTTLTDELEHLACDDYEVILRWGFEILDGLKEAHKAGIVHRDIKPDNILVTKSKNLKIADFGIARLSGESTNTGLTAEGTLIGTPAYMAPEQISPDPGETVTGKTDHYAVGTILYRMVTGRMPFQSQNIGELLSKQLREIPVRPSLLNPSIPVALENLILQLLKKKASERPENPSDNVQEIRLSMGHLSLSSNSISLPNLSSSEQKITLESTTTKKIPDNPTITRQDIRPGKIADNPTITRQNTNLPRTDRKSYRQRAQRPLRPLSSIRAVSSLPETSSASPLFHRLSTRAKFGVLAIIVILFSGGGFYSFNHFPDPHKPISHATPAPSRPREPEIKGDVKMYIRHCAIDIDFQATSPAKEPWVKFEYIAQGENVTISKKARLVDVSPKTGEASYYVRYETGNLKQRLTATITGFTEEVSFPIKALKDDTILSLDGTKTLTYNQMIFRSAMATLKNEHFELYEKGHALLRERTLNRLKADMPYYEVQFSSGPVISNDTLYLGTTSGKIVAYTLNDNGSIDKQWEFNDPAPNYGTFPVFSVHNKRMNAFACRRYYNAPQLFGDKAYETHPGITGDFQTLLTSITEKMRRSLSSSEVNVPALFSLNTLERRNSRDKKLAANICRTFEEHKTTYGNFAEKNRPPEYLIRKMIKDFHFGFEEDMALAWYKPENIRSKFAPIMFDGYIFYTSFEMDSNKDFFEDHGRIDYAKVKWYFKCMDPATGTGWTFYTGKEASYGGFSFDKLNERVYFADNEDFYCLNYGKRNALAKKNNTSVEELSSLPNVVHGDFGEFSVKNALIKDSLPVGHPLRKGTSVTITGPPVIISHRTSKEKTETYLFLWIDDLKKAWNSALAFNEYVPSMSQHLNKNWNNGSCIAPTLFAFQISQDGGECTFLKEYESNNMADAQIVSKERFYHSSFTDSERNLFLVAVGSHLYLFNTGKSEVSSPLDFILVKNIMSAASKIGGCALHKNNIYFTLSNANASITMVKKISFSPSLLKEFNGE